MEILERYKKRGYFTHELYYLLVKKMLVEDADEIIPSEYLKEMRLTTAERLHRLNDILVDNLIPTSTKCDDKVLLSFTPRILIFQNFKPNDKIVAKFHVTNISQAPVFLSLVPKDSSSFTVKPHAGQLPCRLAPGITLTFLVTFRPSKLQDYIHEVFFHTAFSDYVIILIGMAPRPLLDLPDDIKILPTPLKKEVTYLLTVHNIGEVPAALTFDTKCPFSVSPKSVYLNKGEKVVVKVIFKTMRLGEIRGVLYAELESGEKFRIFMYGATHTVSIVLEKQIVRFLDTFKTMVRQQTLKITNNSDHALTFMCMKNDCVYYDFEDKLKLATIFNRFKDSECEKYRRLVEYDVLSSEEHERVYMRIFLDEIQALAVDETLCFQNSHFSINPSSGKLWPNAMTELTITFNPKEIGTFEAITYIDIDGIFNRIPLKMTGKSLPPYIALNVETLNISSVYINKVYYYEVVATNKGHINGFIEYKDVPSLFGSRIDCTPKTYCLKPGASEIFVISFCNSNQGSFFEEINFTIRDTNVVLKIYLKGEVIYPKVSFSIPCLDFGIVSVGITSVIEFDILNESEVHVSADLKVSTDGPEINSIKLKDYAVADRPKPMFPKWPREFKIVPKFIVIDPETSLRVKVKVTPNLIRRNETFLELEMQNSDSPPILLPVKYTAMVPEITRSNNIQLRSCFINYPYEQTISFSSNGLASYFTFMEPEEPTDLEVDVKIKEGFIEPNSTVTIPIVIKTSVVGPHTYSLKFHLFGLVDPQEVCYIEVCGIRPIVTVSPTSLHWGQLKLLTRSTKTLNVINDSPCFVNFKASLHNKDGRWNISPAEGTLEPESETEFLLSLCLVDADTFTNRAVIHLDNVKDIYVPLTVTGIGTSIIVGEARDKLLLGRHFTNEPFEVCVDMINCGTRLHTLEWSDTMKLGNNIKKPKTDKIVSKSFFTLEPKNVKMEAKEQVQLCVSGISHKATTMTETWYLIGSVEGINKKELLISCQVTAEFVDPKLEVSPQSIELRYDNGPYSEFYKLTDKVVVKNVSKLPVIVEMVVRPPFAMIQPAEATELNEFTCKCANCENEETIEYVPSKTYVDCLNLKPIKPVRKDQLDVFNDIHKIKKYFPVTHVIEKHLEHKETIKFMVILDTTKHTSLKSKVYTDVIRIKAKGHKNRDSVKLVGKINFPNLSISASRLDFVCVTNGSVKCLTLGLQNVTPLLVCYKLRWKKCNISITPPVIKQEEVTESEIKSQSPVKSVSTVGTTDQDSKKISSVAMDTTQKSVTDQVVDASAISTYSYIEETEEELLIRKSREKIAPMLNPDYDIKFEWLAKFPSLFKTSKIDINDYLFATPHRGQLKHDQKQNINFIFKPAFNTTIKGVLECSVLGGYTETIVVTAQSSELRYELETQRVNFRIRAFQLRAVETLRIRSTSPLCFEYRTYLNEPKFTNDLEARIIDIDPRESELEYEHWCDMKIVVQPGVIGYFNRRFLIEIAHLPALPVEVYGWGVIPQIYMRCERPEMWKLRRELGFNAISMLTTEYLDEIDKIFSKYKQRHLNSPYTDSPIESPHFNDEWHYCTNADRYPTHMDIELAMERYLVIQYFRKNPDILTKYVYDELNTSIPGFVSIPYVLDFGVVITGSQVRQVVDIVNYGPVPAKLHLTKGTKLPHYLNMKICGRLNPGETGKLEIGFSPTAQDFTKLEQQLELEFSFEVMCGCVLPLTVQALCAVPYLATNVTAINFGTVKCGNKVTISIPLKNIGKPVCLWYVTLRVRTIGPNPLSINQTSGEYKPGGSGIFTVSFKPRMEGSYEGALVFRFHMNPKKLILPVSGHAVSPHIHIIGPNIVFPPTLPWSQQTEIYFGISNPCPFPIELIFAHSDERWTIEDEVMALLNKYYGYPEELVVPAITPGAGLPHEIVDFVKYYKDRISKALLIEASAAAAALKASAKKGGNKSPRSAKRVAPKKKDRTPRTDEEVINDEIKAMKDEGIDPIKAAIRRVFQTAGGGEQIESTKINKGVMIIFHGSPFEEMQGQEIASNASKKLKLPLINIDNAFIDALCCIKSEASYSLISALLERYKAVYVAPLEVHEQDFEESKIADSSTMDRGDYDRELLLEETLEELEGDEFELERNFENLLEKLEYIAHAPLTKADKKSSRSKTTHVTLSTTGASLLGATLFNNELTTSLMTEYFNRPEFNKGFVVESLTSLVIKHPPHALISLLKYKPNIATAQLVLCHSEFANWASKFEEKFTKEQENFDPISMTSIKEYTDEEIVTIINDFEGMDDKEYEDATPELKEIYIKYGLEERRDRYKAKTKSPTRLSVMTSDSSKPQKGKETIRPTMQNAQSNVDAKKKQKKDESKQCKSGYLPYFIPDDGALDFIKLAPEYIAMNAKYNEYNKMTYENLVNIACNWMFDEKDLASPLFWLNGMALGTHKKGKQSQKKLTSASDIQLAPSDSAQIDRGFPLIMLLGEGIVYKRAVSNYLSSLKQIIQALKDEEVQEVLKNPLDRREFTVLQPKVKPPIAEPDQLDFKFLDEPLIKHCECNALTDMHILDDSNQSNVLNILSKWHCICGKKLMTSQTSTSAIPIEQGLIRVISSTSNSEETELVPAPVACVHSLESCLERPVLNYGDLMRCKFVYNPRKEGPHTLKRFVQIFGWPESRIPIVATGICDIPRLDSRPKKMFKNFVRTSTENKFYKSCYLNDQKVFQFGAIFVGAHRIYEEKYTIDLRNSSLITADTDIQFMYDSPVFLNNARFISLEPGRRDRLIISAAPGVVGEHTNTLLFCVKDNPEVIAINIACTGVLPAIEILPLSKSIDYGRLLLYRREDDRFIVKNDSVLPIKWQIRNPEDFAHDFIVTPLSGIVPSNENQVVKVKYIACRVGIINNLQMTIDMYDDRGRGEPIIVDNLQFSAECYDALIECAFENPAESYLNYGNVKVNSTVVRDMYLLNRGKYNVYYKIKKVKNFPVPDLLKSFEYTQSGVVPATIKLVTIEFACTPNAALNLNNVPAFTCTLIDGSKNQVVIAEFPICLTIASFYNTFTLFPLGELNFHVIAVGSSVTREVIINNTSKCPIMYEIILPKKYRVSPEEALAAAALSAKSDKRPKLKKPGSPCGNFTIMNDDNLLAPGTSRTIPIEFSAAEAIRYQETIKFVVSDTCPAEAYGVPLSLVGVGAVPTLDLWNTENTFREHLIVRSLSDHKFPECTPHCVFVEESFTLHFLSVIVQTKFTGGIDLYNNGLVPAALTMKLIYQPNTNSSIFSLDKYETYIESLMHTTLTVIFTPRELKEYRAVLEIKLKLYDNNEQIFKICLIGTGVIPRIEMIKPKLRRLKSGVLKMPVTCLGSISDRKIIFKNASTVLCVVSVKIVRQPTERRKVFWLTERKENEEYSPKEDENMPKKIVIKIKPEEKSIIGLNFFPINKGKTSCDIEITIADNPFESYKIYSFGEAFMEDVILLGLQLLSLEVDAFEGDSDSVPEETKLQKRSKSAVVTPVVEKKETSSKKKDVKRKKSQENAKEAEIITDVPVLKYILDIGGTTLCCLQRRTVIMSNNSEKVYRFTWDETENIKFKPSIGYISPGEEKDLEVMFFSTTNIVINKEPLKCLLIAIRDENLNMLATCTNWDNRQTSTLFEHNQDLSINERFEDVVIEQAASPTDPTYGILSIVLLFSAAAEYAKYQCDLPAEKRLLDTYIYQNRKFKFEVKNTGRVDFRINWSFQIDEEYPARIDRKAIEAAKPAPAPVAVVDEVAEPKIETSTTEADKKELGKEESKMTLYSCSSMRESVDTWFEQDMPFKIEPQECCLKPNETKTFCVTFAPLECFDYNVRLKSNIENLDTMYDQNKSCKLTGKSLIPYCYLDMEESDYLSGGRRKIAGVQPPKHTNVLEFNVLGYGCYKKTFNIINPTCDGYEFLFVNDVSDNVVLMPVHCDPLKGYVEGGISFPITFTFSPTQPGVYESYWRFLVPLHQLTIRLLVVGIVREPQVIFIPTILTIPNTLVGFTTTTTVIIRNPESEKLKYEFKGNSLPDPRGLRPLRIEPEVGYLPPMSDTPVKVVFCPCDDGPTAFKVFCNITYMVKQLIICVNTLSHSITPKITYYIIGYEHVLDSGPITNIYLDETASTYERIVKFNIKNEGTATFFYDWAYSCKKVKKYLNVFVEPKAGHIAPGKEIDCNLHFILKKIPVKAFPVDLIIKDGPTYNILLHADIKKPMYRFSHKEVDFGKCLINAPETTYSKSIAVFNNDTEPITFYLNFPNNPGLIVDYDQEEFIPPKKRVKFTLYFRPKNVKNYEFTLQFWINTLCEENVTIRGEGVALLFDLYEGCQKSFNLGPVKVGQKIVREIQVINHSKVPIDSTFVFKAMYPMTSEDDMRSEGTSVCLDPTSASPTSRNSPVSDISRSKMMKLYKEAKYQEEVSKDIEFAMSSLKCVPNNIRINPHKKVTLKIHFKPVGHIGNLDVQLNMCVLNMVRPLVRLSGSATNMQLSLSQNSLQFGRVRRRGCRVMKILLNNTGDYDTRFWWQPLNTDEFTISPFSGEIQAHSSVTFTVTFRPKHYNTFIKVWASCNVLNHMPLDLAIYASCMDVGVVTNRTMRFECPVRDTQTEPVPVTNPTDEEWLVLSEVTEGPFETISEVYVAPNSTFEIPLSFKPKVQGIHEAQVLFTSLGQDAMVVSLTGHAIDPRPNSVIVFSVPAGEVYTEVLQLYNISEYPESYVMTTELVSVDPPKFEGYYDFQHATVVKTWGEAVAKCKWDFACYGECKMDIKVRFTNEETFEYQFYEVKATVLPSEVVATIEDFESHARESVQREIVIRNPLSTEAIYTVTSNLVTCEVNSLTIPRNSKESLAVTYSPLVEGEYEDTLEVFNSLVGSRYYRLKLRCLPAKPKELEFSTPFGTSIPIRLRVHNRTDNSADFTTTVSHPCIRADNRYTVDRQKKGKCVVQFEPVTLGEQKCEVAFDSPTAGKFLFKINGTATYPEPQGPYDIRPGGFAIITFKNVYEETTSFKITADVEHFYVKTMLETLEPKKEIKLPVYMLERSQLDIRERRNEKVVGILFIENAHETDKKCVWTYFLRGII